ncbi:MBL fold metallo-hydrolase [Sporosarcina sp. NPDC096371]|uniref:MBL fold metallo-hydrolase n=1 Tax=Sporosarcina sp. NPDC096371 TaxID=3364530 RepID=UPI0038011B38
MKIEFLGTGGAMPVPRPLCTCRVCVEARIKGFPYSRSGPSLFVHGPNILIDTSEDIYSQINRSTIEKIEGVFYSHWHPDHVMGRRVLESINADWVNNPPENSRSDVYLPEQVASDIKHFLGTADHMAFFSEQGYIKLHELKDGDSVVKNQTKITPFRLVEDYVYGFLLATTDKRVLIVMDELNNWNPSEYIGKIDLAVLPIGIFDVHPITGERLLSSDHPVLKEECTFDETLDILRKLNPKKTIFTHIEEVGGLSFDDLLEVEKKLTKEGLVVKIAYDTLVVNV